MQPASAQLHQLSLALEKLGDPHLAAPSILIGGTNGKGSVAKLMARAFNRAGFKVGLFTSPHLQHERERIRVNGRAIAISELDAWKVQIQADRLDLPWFAVQFLLSQCYFAAEKTDYNVIEVGLGGRLDPTNLCRPIISVITTIGLDHTEHLGSNLADILLEKLPIARPNCPLVVGELSGELMTLATSWCTEHGVELCFVPLNGIIDYEEINRSIAAYALHILSAKIANLRSSSLEADLKAVKIAGRFQQIGAVTVDLAHNDSALFALAHKMQAPFDLIVAKPRAKIWQQGLVALLKKTRSVFVLDLGDEYFEPATQFTASIMRLGFTNVKVLNDLASHLKSTRNRTLVCGSVRLAGRALACLEVDTTEYDRY